MKETKDPELRADYGVCCSTTLVYIEHYTVTFYLTITHPEPLL